MGDAVMRRQIWLILGGLVAGVALVSLLAFDAGYVLVQFAHYRLETTLVAAGIALFLFLWILRASFRFLSVILGLGPGLGRWLEKRREDKASALLRETLVSMFDERTGNVAQQLPKLMKGDLFSHTERAKAEAWALKRQLEATTKPDQLKRLWSGAKAELKQAPEMSAHYAGQLCRLGRSKEAELELQALSKRTWTASATHALAQINLNDAPSMVNALTELSGNRSANDVANGLVIAKAQLLPKSDAEKTLIEHYGKQPAPYLVTALGTIGVKKS
jgi:uncharacterized protein HemY